MNVHSLDQGRSNMLASEPNPALALADAKQANGSFTSVLLQANSSLLSGTDSSHSLISQASLGSEPPPGRASFELQQQLRQHPSRARGSCRKCVECSRLTAHDSYDRTRMLWPGQLSSPVTYFTISRRRLDHQIASVPRTSRIWVQGRQYMPQRRHESTIAMRRGLGLTLDILIPVTRTNVAYKASHVSLIGVKTLSVSRVLNSAARKESKRRCMSWRREEGALLPQQGHVPHLQQPCQQPQPSPFLSSQPMVVLDSCLATENPNKESQDSTVPVLMSRQSSGMMSVDDPTMQEYVQHQYAIKKERAFACHHAIDIADVAKVHDEEVKSSSKKFFGFLSSFLPTTQTT